MTELYLEINLYEHGLRLEKTIEEGSFYITDRGGSWIHVIGSLELCSKWFDRYLLYLKKEIEA